MHKSNETTACWTTTIDKRMRCHACHRKMSPLWGVAKIIKGRLRPETEIHFCKPCARDMATQFFEMVDHPLVLNKKKTRKG